MRVPCLLRNELLNMLKNSRKFYSTSFNINYQFSDKYKLTMSVSCKYGKAYKRNLIRRQIYNLLHNKYTNIYVWIRINDKHKLTTYTDINNNIQAFDKVIKHKLNIINNNI